MKKRKKTFCFILAVSAVLTTGCAGVNSGGMEYDFTESDEKIAYTFFAPNWQDYEGAQKDRVIAFLEEKFNIAINITGSSSGTWQSRIATEIADNNTPDVFFSLPNTSTYTDYIKKQIITDLNPYIEKAQANTLAEVLTSEQYKTSTLIDGKNYFLPQSVGYTTRIISVRKDWMAKWNVASVSDGGRGLGEDEKFSVPDTLSDFTSMLTYFRERDPDGDGKKNTYGLALSKNFDFVQDFFATFGLQPEYYIDADGKFQLSVYNENYDKMLDWFKAGNESGYIQTGFYALEEGDAVRNFLTGKCGALVSTGDGQLDGLISSIEKQNNGSYKDFITLLAPPDSDDGKYKGAFKGWNFFWGGWSISAEAKEPMRLIRLFDYLVSPEGQDLMVYGVKGVHYTVEDGKKIPNLKERLADGVSPYAFLSPNDRNVDVDGVMKREVTGRYVIGTQWMPCPYTLENGKLKTNYPYDTAKDAELTKLQYKYTTENLNFNALRTIISDPDINDYSTKIVDAVEIYTTNVIAGKNKQAEWDSLQKKLMSYHKDDVLNYVNR